MSVSAAVQPPCTLAIDSEEAFAQWTTIDANNDQGNYQFKYVDGTGALYAENRYGDANDWLISPAVALEAGKTYKVTISCRNMSTYSSDKQNFTITYGEGVTVADQSKEIGSVRDMTKTDWMVEKTSNEFSPEASGDYNIGLHLTSKSWQGNFGVASFKVEEVKALPGAIKDLTATAAPDGEMKVTLSWTWPLVNSLNGPGMDCTGAIIYRSATYSFTPSDSYKIAETTVGGAPGEAASYVDESLSESGEYYYKVIPVCDDGASPLSTSSAEAGWVGPDDSLTPVTNLTATAVEGNDKAIRLTWDKPVGAHGAYVDYSKVAYTIMRSKDGASDETLVSAWTPDAEPIAYTDDPVPGLGKYVYTVKTVYDGSTSFSGAKSDPVVTGGTMELPYSNSFNTAGSTDLFTFFHGPDVTRDWSRTSSKNALFYWGSPADAYAALPQLQFEAGKAYEISFSTYVQRASSPKNLSLYIGQEPTVEAMTTELFAETIASTYSATKTVVFSVSETGVYNLAFRVNGPSDSNDIYVDDLLVQETEVVPAGVTDASATAAPDGVLKAIVNWTNPDKTNAGTELTSIDKVEILVDTDVVATVTDAVPGQPSSAEIPVPASGKYTFGIVVYSGEAASSKVNVETPWVGYDVPAAPANLAVTNGEDGRTITFDAVTTGVNGGYVDAPAIHYIILRDNVTIADDVTGTTYTDTEKDLPLAKYTYSVKAVNGDVESAPASATIVFGDALALPYNPDFESAEPFTLWSLPENAEGWGWSYRQGSAYLLTESNDTWAFTPPFHAQGGKVKLAFKATCYTARYPEDLTISLVRAADPADPQTVGESQQFHIESPSSYTDTKEAIFEVPRPGVYYIAYYLETANWTLYLRQSDISQYIVTGVELPSIDSTDTVSVYDLNGVQLGVTEASELGSLAPGIYIVRVTDAEGNVTTHKIAIK